MKNVREYVVVAYERGRAVCEWWVGFEAAGVTGACVRELRAEFPHAVVAIQPTATYTNRIGQLTA